MKCNLPGRHSLFWKLACLLVAFCLLMIWLSWSWGRYMEQRNQFLSDEARGTLTRYATEAEQAACWLISPIDLANWSVAADAAVIPDNVPLIPLATHSARLADSPAEDAMASAVRCSCPEAEATPPTTSPTMRSKRVATSRISAVRSSRSAKSPRAVSASRSRIAASSSAPARKTVNARAISPDGLPSTRTSRIASDSASATRSSWQ